MYLIGQSTDIHKITKTDSEKNIILGGHKFKSIYKIVAHSDGDLVLHAIANAILGALQMGDIGMYFPDTKKENKNIDSKEIVNFCLEKMHECGYKINNIDLTIISERIMINDKRKDIVWSLVKILDTNKVNVKATRFEDTENNMIKCDVITLLYKGENNEK